MKRKEIVYREILYNAIEEKKMKFTQLELSRKLGISLSIVNEAIGKLSDIGGVKIEQRSFRILDIKKILYYWASLRNLKKDIVFETRVEMPVSEIEKNMPEVVYTAYSGYKFRFKDVPADYSEVYVYADEKQLEIIKKRFGSAESGTRPNLFVLKKDSTLGLYKNIPIVQLFIDLWNLKEWYAKDFLNALEKRVGVI